MRSAPGLYARIQHRGINAALDRLEIGGCGVKRGDLGGEFRGHGRVIPRLLDMVRDSLVKMLCGQLRRVGRGKLKRPMIGWAVQAFILDTLRARIGTGDEETTKQDESCE